uniref:Uncharacterized protein n=1 Tax=Cyclopterus lumpus TaxID=8103 RepID=A0A8C2WUU6_CYCLU
MYLVFSICLYLPGVGVMFVALIVPGIATTHIHKCCMLLCLFSKLKSLVFPWHWYLMERDRRVSGTRTVL